MNTTTAARILAEHRKNDEPEFEHLLSNRDRERGSDTIMKRKTPRNEEEWN